MNNEPVVWMSEVEGGTMYTNYEYPKSVPLYTHPVKELDEQFEKGFKAGKEEGWKAHKFHHPVKEQDESFDRTASHMAGVYVSYPVKEQDTDCQYCKQGCIRCDARKQLTDEKIGQFKGEWYRGDYASFYDLVRAILRKAQEQ